ncbi:sulfatase-like hydrolase/transferase [Ruminococcaceae bacterium OttesenSCG-928-L11]|nr:sulfatase-like hydrolase/transferase [Ruminococcaceae bacterium OttesenSCG-928-L11]
MNYILFFPDELRAETLSCYGNSKINTPNFDRLAREGVQFDQCHVQNTVCSPSRVSLFTGQYVHTNGHRTLWNLLQPHEHNMMRYLKDAGYEVRIYGKNDVLSQEAIPLSTDEFINHPTKTTKRPEPINGYGYDFLYDPVEGDYTDHNDYQNLKAGMDFIKSRKEGDKPFVLFLPLVMPHCPYTIQEPYYSMYSEEDIPELRPEGTNKPIFHGLIRQYRELKDANFKKIQAIYMGMTSFMDQLLGELMDCVKEAGIEDETMLFASADHGDYAGDYNLVEKWPSGCEDVLTRVPLIVRAPGCKAGHKVAEQVELFDIMATVLEDAGIECKHTHFARSLAPQLAGGKGDPDRAVFCEGGYNPNEPHCNEGIHKRQTAFMNSPQFVYYPKGLQQKEHPESVGRATMLRTLDYKLVKRSFKDNELYDLKADPLELNNVYGDDAYAGIQAELEQRMLQWYVDTSDCVRTEEDPRGVTPDSF